MIAHFIEQALAANEVDLLLQRDWEDVQIYLGLLDKHLTPPPDNGASMAKQLGFDPGALLDNLKQATQAQRQHQCERQVATWAKAKTKAKRKQQRKRK